MIAIVAAALSVAAAVLLAGPGPVPGVWGYRPLRLRVWRAPHPAREPGSAPVLLAATAAPLSVPMLLDLVAEVLASGASPPRALAAVGESLERVRDPNGAELIRLARRLSGADGPDRRDRSATAPAPHAAGETLTQSSGWSVPGHGAHVLAGALALSVATGAGPVMLIRAAAEEQRRRLQAEQVRAAHRLGVMVLLPTGLCLLPAFVLLTVVPLVIDLVLG